MPSISKNKVQRLDRFDPQSCYDNLDKVAKTIGEAVLLKNFFFLSLMVVLCDPIFAENKGYWGGSLGSTDYDSVGFDNATGFQIRGGYQINEHLAVEGGYLYGGETDDDDGRYSWIIKGGAIQAALKLSTNISESVFGYVKGGMAIWNFEQDRSATTQGIDDENGSDLFYGIGFGWNFNEAGRAFIERQTISVESDSLDGDATTVSIGVEFAL